MQSACVVYIVICDLFESTAFYHATEHKIFVLIFSTKFVCNIFRSKKEWTRHYHKCILAVAVICVTF